MDLAQEVESFALEDAVRRARVRWPGIGCGPSELADHVRQLGDAVGDLGRFGDELHLACASCRLDPLALRILDREYISRTSGTLSRLKAGADFTQETMQTLRHRLLLPPEPRLARYAATGPLLGWLRVVVLRLGLDLRRSGGPPRDEALAVAFLEQGPADTMDLQRYQGAVAAAIHAAFSQLLAAERNLLRLHHLDGVSLDQLGVLNGVHRATIARRLAELRQRVMNAAQQEVAVRHKLTKSELRSVFRKALSTLDAVGLFKDTSGPEA
jgi:RNA polymerase sigma-70 factor (ECF subfamily)